ncbi:MAG: GNAT family N-acetyltransferase [Thermomicrobiales bacterium]
MTRNAQLLNSTNAGADIRFEPTADGATKAALVVDGVEASRAYIIPFTIRVGAATVRMDGIGGVATPEEHRNRGYSRHVLQAAVDFMRAGDAALSTLYGIPDFYPKFGYATLGPYHVIRLTDPSRVPDLPAGYRVRPLSTTDLPAVSRLYEQNTHHLVGPVVRDQSSRSTVRLAKAAARPNECRVVVREPDDVVAYLWRGSRNWWTTEGERHAPHGLAIAEIVANDPAAAEAALGAARRWASEAGKSEINISAPPDDPVAAAAMFLNARFETHHARDADFMGRCLNLTTLFVALAPELSYRISGSRTSFTGLLRIVTDEGSATLSMTPDTVMLSSDDQSQTASPELTVRMPQHELARLVFGGFPPREILARLPEPPTEPTAELLSILFPRRHPYIFPADWF